MIIIITILIILRVSPGLGFTGFQTRATRGGLEQEYSDMKLLRKVPKILHDFEHPHGPSATLILNIALTHGQTE